MAAVASVLVTGAAGFIGYHVNQRLVESGRSGGLNEPRRFFFKGRQVCRLGPRRVWACVAATAARQCQPAVAASECFVNIGAAPG